MQLRLTGVDNNEPKGSGMYQGMSEGSSPPEIVRKKDYLTPHENDGSPSKESVRRFEGVMSLLAVRRISKDQNRAQENQDCI